MDRQLRINQFLDRHTSRLVDTRDDLHSSFGKIMFVTAALIYLISRILFIYKGFKIFYRNILDLFYFIVYLCALEITPLFWVYRSSILIYNFVELKIQQL